MNIDIAWLQSHFPDLRSLAVLGQGGHKLVFSAIHPTYGHVVLKLIQPSQSIESIRREVLAVQQVQSPRVPQILLTGIINTQLGTCFWLIEPRIRGDTVRALLATGPLSLLRLLRCGLHVLQALDKAEEMDIVHRDVKPDNLMMDSAENFWLLDFGIARHLKLSSQTATADIYGKFTPGYAPIEQFRNKKHDIDGRADLFALGVTLYECATGVNPFYAGAINQLDILRHVENRHLPPLQLPFTSAKEFAYLIGAMTQKRYDHRPGTVREALEWMEEICKAEGIN